MVGSALALQSALERRLAAMGVRAATGQFGYLLGAAVGGVALAAGGYALLAVSLAAVFGPRHGSAPRRDRLPDQEAVREGQLGLSSVEVRPRRGVVRCRSTGLPSARRGTAEPMPA